MVIQFMHFSSLEVPFSSLSKIFIHPENGGTGSRGWGLAGRVGAGLTGPARAVWCSQTPSRPTSTLFHFLLVCGALVRCASLRSALRCSHTLSLCRSQPPLRFRVCAARERPFFSTSSLLSSRNFTLTLSAPACPGCCPCFALLGFACVSIYEGTSCLFKYFFVSVLQCRDVAEGGVRS